MPVPGQRAGGNAVRWETRGLSTGRKAHDATLSLDAIADQARVLVNVAPSEVDPTHAKDPYNLLWPRFVRSAREDVLLSLLGEGDLLPQTDAVFPVTGRRAYDLIETGGHPFVEVVRVFYGTETNRRPLSMYDGETGGAMDRNPDITGQPAHWYREGLTGFTLWPIPTDTTQNIYVTGITAPETGDPAAGKFPALWNNCVAARAAIWACKYDRFNPEMQAAMADCTQEFAAALINVRDMLIRFTPARRGFRAVGRQTLLQRGPVTRRRG